MVGYCGDCGDKDGYRVYVPDRDNVVTSRDVIFKEEQPTSSEEVDSGSEVEVKLQNETDHIPDECDEVQDSGRRTLRDRRQIQLPVRYEDYAMFAGYTEPKCYTEAMRSEDSQEWQLAMDDEIKSLDENNTWEWGAFQRSAWAGV